MGGLGKNIALLAACQGLLLANGITLIAVNGLLGFALAPDARLATLPVTTYVIGAALTTVPASMLMKRRGRRAGFTLGAGLGLVAAAICASAVVLSSFWLLCLGTVVAGMYNACGQYYRFAAADAAPAALKSRAISWVLAGGIIGGVLGPETSKLTRDLLAPQFLATYFALGGFALLALLLVRHIDLPAQSAEERHGAGRPLRDIVAQPAFVAAVTAAVVGYAVMNLLMTATPLAMDLCRHPFGDAALVLEWHVIAMFAPAFFTGGLIVRFGAPAILLLGAALQAVCAAIALSGVSLMHFWWALVLLGVGWNFLYIGGTTLLTETYTPAEKAKVQGVNDFSVFAAQALSSLAAGFLLTRNGWDALNLAVLPLIALTVGATLWMVRNRRSITA